MSGKHTPAPWIAVGRMVEVPSDKRADICSTDPYVFGQGHFARSIEEAEANARLIAAAPDLLAALRGLLDTSGDDVLDSEVAGNAYAAIAKATMP